MDEHYGNDENVVNHFQLDDFKYSMKRLGAIFRTMKYPDNDQREGKGDHEEKTVDTVAKEGHNLLEVSNFPRHLFNDVGIE